MSPWVRLLRIPGVYEPRRDSLLLARSIPEHLRKGDRVLDLFTGSGMLAVTAAAAGAGEVWAVDVSRRAVLSASLNARLNGVEVTARRGSIFEPVEGRRFDLILANPPYVPGEQEVAAARGAARAWEAGPDGRRFLDPFLEGLPEHLSSNGRVLLVQSSLADVARTIEALAAAGIDAEILVREETPLGPITAPRTKSLEERGLLRPGERTEETVVIAGAIRKADVVPAEQPVAAMSSG